MKKQMQAFAVLATLCIYLFVGCTENSSSSNSSSTTSPSILTDTSKDLLRDYDTVLSLRSEGYQSLSLRDFNATVKTAIDKDVDFLNLFSDLMGKLTPEDSEYQFVYETLNYSTDEIIYPQLGEALSFSRFLKKQEGPYDGNNGEIYYSFIFTALYSVEYRLIDEAKLTVSERDELLRAYQTELQKAIEDMDKEQLVAGGFKLKLQKIADDLANKLSTNELIFENAEVHTIEILDEGQDYRQ